MLKFNVFNQRLIRVDKNNPATDSVEYLEAQFIFNTDDWNGKTKSAIFTKGTSSYTVLLDSKGVCKVPFEVLQSNESSKLLGNTDKISVSLVGIYNTVRITTNEVKINLNYSGYTEGQEPSEPTAEMYEQILTAYADAEAKCEEATNECVEAQNKLDSVGNIFANAIKGNVSGEFVKLDDVSPVNHIPIVKVNCPDGIEPTNIKLIKCGKNLIKPRAYTTNTGYSTTINLDGSVTVTGAANTTDSIYLMLSTVSDDYPLRLRKDVMYTMQGYSSNGKEISVKTINSEGEESWTTSESWDKNLGTDFTNIAQIFIESTGHQIGDTSLCGIYKFQIEAGEKTDFEAYKETIEYIPTSDGIVEGITSLSPNMTILTDTQDVTIECEYNKDINVVLNKITDALGIEI